MIWETITSPVFWFSALTLLTLNAWLGLETGRMVGAWEARDTVVAQYVEPTEFAKFGFKGTLP